MKNKRDQHIHSLVTKKERKKNGDVSSGWTTNEALREKDALKEFFCSVISHAYVGESKSEIVHTIKYVINCKNR